MATLCLLTALVALASLSVATRLYPTTPTSAEPNASPSPESRSERLLAALVVFVGTVELSLQLLGWTDSLSRGSLLALVVVVSAAMLAGSLFPDPKAKLSALGTALVETIRLPFAALAVARDAKQPILGVGLVVVYGVVVWTTWLAYLAPSEGWDGVWYHETIAYFPIQTGSFRIPTMPVNLALVEGYPRGTENLMTWIALFDGRRFVDGVGLLTFPMSMLGIFALVREGTRSTVTALGAAVAVVLVPGAVLQLRSTYVDLTVLAAFVASAHFATRRTFGTRELWMAGLAVGVLASTKANQLVFGGLFGLFALARVIALVARERSGKVAAHGALAFAASFAIFAPGYVRNHLRHDNPIWPLRYHSERLGLELEGPLDIANMHVAPEALLGQLFDVPSQGQDYVDTRMHAYGYGMTYLVLPLVVVALGVMASVWARAVARRDAAERSSVARLFFLFVVAALLFATSPALQWARFTLGGVAIATALVCWLLERRPWGLSPEGPLAAIVFANLLTLAWAEPAWQVPPERVMELAALSPYERPLAEAAGVLFHDDIRRWREERIGRDDVVVFDDDISFVSNCWNEHVSNRAVYVPFDARDSYLAELDRLEAEWVIVWEHRDEFRALHATPEIWTEIGVAQFEMRVFERREAE